MTLDDLSTELATAHLDSTAGGVPATPTDMLRLRQAIDGLVPFEMAYPDAKACVRVARLTLLSYLLARPVGSSKDLSRGEAWRITAWLNGQHPYTFKPEPNQGATAAARQEEVRKWLARAERKIKTRTVARPNRRTPHQKSGGYSFARSSPSTA